MPKIIDHDKQREEIIFKSFDLFSTKGFASVTMRELARELEVSTGLLYHYFSTKEAIFEQMIQFVIEKDISRVKAGIDPDLSLSEKIITAGRLIESNKSYYQNLILLMVDYIRFVGKDEAKKIMESFSTNYLDAISSHLSLSETFSTILLSWLAGLMYCSLTVQDMIPFEKQFASMAEMITLVAQNNQGLS